MSRSLRPALIALLVLAAVAPAAQAQQRLGYVDTDRVLELLPEYRSAQQEVERLVVQWQAEIDAAGRAVAEAEATFAARELLYTADERAGRLSEIGTLRQEGDALRRRYFGPEGELFREQQARLRPVQERVLAAVEEVAEQDNIDLVIDRSGDVVLLFARPQLDLTTRVLDALGVGLGAGTPSGTSPR